MNEGEVGIVLGAASFALHIIMKFWKGGQNSGVDAMRLDQVWKRTDDQALVLSKHGEKFAVQDRINEEQAGINRQFQRVQSDQDQMRGRAEAEREMRARGGK